jgi:hypothetical protein
MDFVFQSRPLDPREEEITSSTGLSQTLTNVGAMITTVGVMGERGAVTDTERDPVMLQSEHGVCITIFEFKTDGHLARRATRFESNVMLLPTVNRPIPPNCITNELESDPDQLHFTSSLVTPSKTNIFLQGKIGGKPPRSVGELKDRTTADPSLENWALTKTGVGGSASEEITLNTLSPE